MKGVTTTPLNTWGAPRLSESFGVSSLYVTPFWSLWSSCRCYIKGWRVFTIQPIREHSDFMTTWYWLTSYITDTRQLSFVFSVKDILNQGYFDRNPVKLFFVISCHKIHERWFGQIFRFWQKQARKDNMIRWMCHTHRPRAKPTHICHDTRA